MLINWFREGHIGSPIIKEIQPDRWKLPNFVMRRDWDTSIDKRLILNQCERKIKWDKYRKIVIYLWLINANKIFTETWLS